MIPAVTRNSGRAFITLCLGALLLSFPAALSAQKAESDWTAALPGSFDKMLSGYYSPSVKAAFGTFTYGDTKLATPFSRWLEDRLADGAAKSSGLKLINENAAAAMDPAFLSIYGDLFKKQNIDALLGGRYTAEGQSVRVRVELTSLSQGVLIGSAEFMVPRSALPPGLAVKPDEKAEETQAQISNIMPAARPGTSGTSGTSGAAGAGTIKVSVSTDRGNAAVYREGEDLKVYVTSERDAYIKVYSISATGTIQLIWPNRFSGGQGRVKAGSVIQIPGPGDNFRFKMVPPYGTEFIKVIASTEPFATREDDFADLGTGSNAARGLMVLGASSTGAQGASGEASASYVITAK